VFGLLHVKEIILLPPLFLLELQITQVASLKSFAVSITNSITTNDF